MKILQLYFAKLINSAGGSEKVFCNYANVFLEKQYSVVCCCCDRDSGKPFYYLNSKVRLINLDAGNLKIPIAVKIKNEINRIKRMIGIRSEWPKEVYVRRKVRQQLADLIDLETPDIIICYEPRSMMLLKECNVDMSKVIVMFHSSAENILNSLSDEQKECLKECGYIQVLMRSFKKFMYENGYSNVIYIPNIVPQYITEEYLKEKTIIHVGRLEKFSKRQHLLIEAFAKISKKYPEWKIKFFGGDSNPWSYENELHNLIRQKGVQNQVFLMGKTSEIEAELRKASIFAFPSAYEGFGLALTEGMSMGLPAIGFNNCPAVNELIQNGSNGILCDESIDALANALEELIVNESERISYGKQAREDMKKYSADKIYAEWDCLIEKVLQEDR